MNDEIKINKMAKSITFINNGIAFSQFGIADEILDLITNLQQKEELLRQEIGDVRKAFDCLQRNYDRIYNENCKLREEHNITDISLLDENYKLKQENERLKEAIAELKAITKRPTPIDYAMMQKRYEDCKSCCEKASEYFKYQLENLDFYEDTKARMLCAMGITLLQNRSDSQ